MDEELDDDDLFDNAPFTSTGRLSDSINVGRGGKVPSSTHHHHINGDIDFNSGAHHSGLTNGYAHRNNYEVHLMLFALSSPKSK